MNNDLASPGHGLVSDNDAKPDMASIASRRVRPYRRYRHRRRNAAG
ncbi:MAG: hypothetical protein MZU97_00350 [Bacillus subtilis]|nr:hypothetical protein [Bacillus subtilis]